MKPLILQLLIAGRNGLPLLAQNSAPKAPDPKPVSPELAALLKFKPKPQKDTARGGRRIIAATRSGGAPPVRLVALAPASGGITVSEQPRLWWWQSADTAAGELEFALTRMDRRPKSLLVVKLGAMKAGYNAIDLSSPAINPGKLALESGVEYQWSLGCFSQLRKDSVSQVRRGGKSAFFHPSPITNARAVARQFGFQREFELIIRTLINSLCLSHEAPFLRHRPQESRHRCHLLRHWLRRPAARRG